MTARPAAGPRTNLVPCSNKPVHHAVIDGPAFIAGFKQLLRAHGVEPGDVSDRALEYADGLAMLAATMSGAQATMPQSLYERFDAMRSKVNARPTEADRQVA